MKQKICVFSICFNEENMIEFYLDYYLNFIKVDKVVICDGGSTDNTHQIIKKYPQVELIIEKQDSANENYLKDKRNNIWKKYKNDFDWVIVCDIDEFLYHPNIHDKLKEYKNNNITIPKTKGYDMISMDFPYFKKGNYLPHIITNGISDDHWLSKKIIFDPNKLEEINFRHGSHDCDPIGEIKYSQTSDLMMLHYKWISYDYLIKKYKFLSNRQGEWNIKNNACTHWDSNSKISEQEFINKFNDSIEYPNNFYKINDTINIKDLEEIKILQLKELENFMKNEKNILLSGDQKIIKIYNKKENGLTDKLLHYLLNLGYEIISKNKDIILSKKKNKDIFIFTHNYLINNWEEILLDQLGKIKISGLYKNTKKLFLCAYGDDNQWFKFNSIIKNYDVDNKIEPYRHKENFYEYYTLQKLWDFCQYNDDVYVSYFHLKGVWSRHNIQTDIEDAYNPSSSIKNTEALLNWRKCLEYFTIERWHLNVDKLDDGYNVVGPLYNYNELEPLFTGNFWWANSNYIKKLERLVYNINDEPFTAKIWCRVKCEKWINTIKNNNFYNLYNPRDLDLYHVVIHTGEYRDDINPKFSILTPTYKRYQELREAINSVVSQTYDNWEMLICSDGEDDNVKFLIDEYKNNKIKYFYTDKTNDYGSTQRNYLTGLSTGKYIIYLDDDNIIYKNSLKELVEKFDEKTGMIIAKIDYDGLDHQLPIDNKILLGKIDTLNAVVDKKYIKYVSWKNYVGHDYEFIKICENNVLNDDKKIKYVTNTIGNHLDRKITKMKMIDSENIHIILEDKIYITTNEDLNNINLIVKGINDNIIYSNQTSIIKDSSYWFFPDDRSFLNGIIVELYDNNNNLIFKSDLIKRIKLNKIKNKIVIFHHNYLEFNWLDILIEQIFELKSSGLYESCYEIIATIYSKDIYNAERKKFKEFIKNEDYLNKWTIVDLYENNYEYDTLKLIKKYCNYKSEDIDICYFHLKGVCSQMVTDLNIGLPYWRKYLNYFTINKWKNNYIKLNEYDVISVDYEFNQMHQKNVIGGHFFWTKSSHVKNLIEPVTTENRYLTEIWITSVDCKVYSNFSSRGVGINDLYLECILPEMYIKDKIVLVGIAKDEDYYIEEWLKYNYKIGFDHIFLFENNWKCNVDLPYLTKIQWPGEYQQMLAYNYFIDMYGDNYDYIAFFDCDEFIVLKKHNNIHDFVKEYGGKNISINWQFYGSDGKLKRENNSVLKSFTKRELGADKHIKSIIYTKIDQWMERAHNPDRPTYDTNGKEIIGPFNYNGPVDVVVINHYRDKSKEDYNVLIKRVNVDAFRLESIDSWEERKDKYIEVEDLTARDFLYGSNKMDHFYYDIQGWSSEEDQGELLKKLLPLLDKNKKLKIAEIGVYQGRQTSMWNVILINEKIDYEYYAIDNFLKLEQINFEYFGDYEMTLKNLEPIKDKITIIKNDSLLESKKYEDEYFDIIYIDASHKYEDVKNDILAWIPKLKFNGIICGDDYISGWPGVVQAIDEYFKGDVNKVGNQQWWQIKNSNMLDLKDNIDNIWNVSNSEYKIQQKENEWKSLLSYIKSNVKTDNILEIGAFTLGSTNSFVNIFKNVISIDINKGDNWDHFKNINNNWNYLIGYSYSNEIIQKIKNMNIKFDVIFIDGDHTYDGVKKDFNIYKQFLNTNGIIILHDIIDTQFHKNAGCFVHEFWNEIKKQYEYIEIIDISDGDDTNLSHRGYKKSDWGGIGILKNIRADDNIGDLNKNIVIFHHNYLIGNWIPIVEGEISEIIKSGLYKDIRSIYTTVYSDDNDYVQFTNLIKKYDIDNKWIIKILNENNFEIDCLNLLYNYCKNNDNVNVLYFNNKGVTHDKPSTKSWRDYMIHFNIKKYRDAIDILKEYDVYGVDLKTHPYLHYSGNFWWSKSEYIKNLNVNTLYLDHFNNKMNINVGFPMHRRHNCEMWICDNLYGKYYIAWESNTDFYINSYDEYLKSENIVYVITSHPNYTMSEDITKKTLERIKSFGEKVILSSHCPVSPELQNLVDYFIYDKNNPLIKHDFFTQSWFTTDDYYALLNITKNDNNFNHALGVFLNYYNSLILAKSQGFNTAVCTNFDMVFSAEDKKVIDYRIKKMKDTGKKAFFMNTPEREGIHYKTIFFITEIDYFLDTFKYITNEKQYSEEMLKVGSNTNCLENFFFHTLKRRTNDLLLEEINEGDLFPTSEINLFSLIEYNTILPVENEPDNFIVWFSSANSLDSRDLDISIIRNGYIIFGENVSIDKQFTYYKKVKFIRGDIFEINFKITNGKEILKNKTIKVNDEIFNDIKSYGNFIDKKNINCI